MSDIGALLQRPTGGAFTSRQAIGQYGRISLEAQVASASPYQLVVMLYTRLLKRIGEAERALSEGDRLKRLRATESALTIVDGLDATLDMEKGGAVAESLHLVYACLIERLLAGEAEGLAQARASVSDLLDAWKQVAEKVD